MKGRGRERKGEEGNGRERKGTEWKGKERKTLVLRECGVLPTSTTADLYRSIVEQHSTTVLAAVELSTDHSDPRESTAHIKAGSQAPLAENQTSSSQVAKPVDPTPVVIIDRESTLTEATRDRSPDHGVVATADSVQQPINATVNHECAPAQLPYIHSPYTNQARSRPIATASRGDSSRTIERSRASCESRSQLLRLYHQPTSLAGV
jgi:hypothetical protein